MESLPIISALNCENCLELLQGKPRFNICTISIRKEEEKMDATFLPTAKLAQVQQCENFKCLLIDTTIFLRPGTSVPELEP